MNQAINITRDLKPAHLTLSSSTTFSPSQPRALRHASTRTTHKRAISCIARAQAVPRMQENDEEKGGTKTDTDIARFGALMKWINDNGGKSDGVDVVKMNNDMALGWGLVAKETHSQGDLLALIPPTLQLNPTTAPLPPPLQQAVVTATSSSPDHAQSAWWLQMAVSLLYQRLQGSKSHFQAFLESLPQGVPGQPLVSTQDAIQLLQFLPMQYRIKLASEALLKFVQEIQAGDGHAAKLLGFPDVDQNVVGWASSMVLSRAVQKDAGALQDTMVPLIDMANHSTDPSCTVTFGQDGTAYLIANKEILEMDAVTVSYGKYDNDELLFRYGFVTDENFNDSVELDLTPSLLELGMCFIQPDSEIKPWQMEALDKIVGVKEGSARKVKLARDYQFSWGLMAALRIVSATKPRLVEGKTVKQLGRWAESLNITNEIEALRYLAGLVSIVIAQFKTNLEQDQEILDSNDTGEKILTASERSAVQFRQQKKKILASILKQVTIRLKELREMQQFQKEQQGDGDTKKKKKKKSKGFGGSSDDNNKEQQQPEKQNQ